MTSSKMPSGFQVENQNYYFSDFVELNVASGSNDFSDGFSLDICATVGEYYLEVMLPTGGQVGLFRRLIKEVPAVDKHTFRVRLLHCKLRYLLVGCEIPADTKYRYAVQAGTFSAQVQERFRTATKLDVAGSVNASAKAGMSGIKVDLGTKASADGSRKLDEVDESTAKIKPEIAVVEHAPFGWTIGHGSLGDPIQAASEYCLNGSYFLQKVKDYPHSCRVNFKPDCPTAELTFILSVRDGLYVERVDGRRPAQADCGTKRLVMEEMRNKLAGIYLEKELRANSELVSDEELHLARLDATATASSSPAQGLPPAAATSQARRAPRATKPTGKPAGPKT